MSFYTDTIQKSPLFPLNQCVNDLALLEPVMRGKVMAIMQDSLAAGQRLMVFETYRSTTRQRALYAAGATQLKTVGCHHYGVACDLVKNISGQPSWKGNFTFLGKLARKYGLVWGGAGAGNLNIGDLCHLQRIRFADQTKLFNGSWFPSATYSAFPKVSFDDDLGEDFS